MVPRHLWADAEKRPPGHRAVTASSVDARLSGDESLAASSRGWAVHGDAAQTPTLTQQPCVGPGLHRGAETGVWTARPQTIGSPQATKLQLPLVSLGPAVP